MKKKILEAFKLPVRTPRSRWDIVIGGVLLFFPVIQFFSLGFLTKKLKRIVDLDKDNVKWDENLKEIFIAGAKAALVIASYLAIPLLLMFLGGFFTTSLSQGKILSIFFFRGQVINLLMSISLLLAIFLLPVALALMLEQERLKKAYDIGEILDRIFLVPRDYLAVYIVILAMYLASIVITVLLLTWQAGLLLAGFLFFYAGMVTVHLIGKVYPRKSVRILLSPEDSKQRLF